LWERGNQREMKKERWNERERERPRERERERGVRERGKEGDGTKKG
jgi:hypothetical protein